MSTEIALKLNESVASAISNKDLKGFEKAFAVAASVDKLKGLLNEEYMKPIMKLQGNRLGFKTDKDGKGGYGETAVRDCLIEAVLMGVQPFGNHFNIIASNTYITKEGFGYLLNNTPGLRYKITPALPRISGNSAAIVMNIKWFIGSGKEQTEALEVAVRVNNGMGADAVIGKATRKARAWLYNNLNDLEISDGDVVDTTFEEVSSKTLVKEKSDTAQKLAESMITKPKEGDIKKVKAADGDGQKEPESEY